MAPTVSRRRIRFGYDKPARKAWRRSLNIRMSGEAWHPLFLGRYLQLIKACTLLFDSRKWLAYGIWGVGEGVELRYKFILLD